MLSGGNFNEGVPPIEQHPLQIRQRPVQKAQSQKRAMETASVSHDEEHQHAVISFADGAKVRRKSEVTKEKRYKKELPPHSG